MKTFYLVARAISLLYAASCEKIPMDEKSEPNIEQITYDDDLLCGRVLNELQDRGCDFTAPFDYGSYLQTKQDRFFRKSLIIG